MIESLRRFWSGFALALLILMPASDADAGVATCAGKEATIVGTKDADTLRGTAGDDVIVGGDGHDVIEGLEGNDTICSGEGYDTVYGGAGDDRLEDTGTVLPHESGGVIPPGFAAGGAGNDVIAGYDVADGEDGNDILMAGPSQGPVNLYGGFGDDTLVGGDVWEDERGDWLWGGLGDDVLYGGDHSDHFYPGLGNDTVVGGEGSDWLWLSDSPGPVWVDLGAGEARGPAGIDSLRGIEVVHGSDFPDYLVGSPRGEVLIGCGGSDVIYGLGGSDALFGDPMPGSILSFDCMAPRTELDLLNGGDGFDLCGIPDLRFACEDPCDDMYYCEP